MYRLHNCLRCYVGEGAGTGAGTEVIFVDQFKINIKTLSIKKTRSLFILCTDQ